MPKATTLQFVRRVACLAQNTLILRPGLRRAKAQLCFTATLDCRVVNRDGALSSAPRLHSFKKRDSVQEPCIPQPHVSRVRRIVPRRTPRRQVELEIGEAEPDLVGAVAAEERPEPAARGRRGRLLALVQFLEDHARRGG